ncbi:hypothetical protein [Streptomyces dioscori]|uniref:hypothetical protein n=1 Tax=Streptomyces dioscori TaxID=2109333 RepID=UPI00131DE8CA|nr:hypothetical protein [Streptomyces dioscori]
MTAPLGRRVAAEATGTGLLVAVVAAVHGPRSAPARHGSGMPAGEPRPVSS